MPSAKELFLAHVNERSPEHSAVAELRRDLTLAKMDALGDAHGLGASELREIVPPLYEKIVVGTIQIAAHVGGILSAAAKWSAASRIASSVSRSTSTSSGFLL